MKILKSLIPPLHSDIPLWMVWRTESGCTAESSHELIHKLPYETCCHISDKDLRYTCMEKLGIRKFPPDISPKLFPLYVG